MARSVGVVFVLLTWCFASVQAARINVKTASQAVGSGTGAVVNADMGSSDNLQVSAVKEDNDKALVDAAMNGNAAEVQRLLDAGADKEAKNKWGQTALYAAVSYGKNDVVKVLLDAGADTEVTSRGSTPLIRAATYSCSRTLCRDVMIQYLIDAKANIEATDNFGNTALIWAAKKGSSAQVKMLLDAGADPNAKDKNGRTVLINAVNYDNPQYWGWSRKSYGPDSVNIVNMLLESGADVTAKDTFSNKKSTALHSAAKYGNTAMVKKLLDSHADKDAQDFRNRTPLMWAAESSYNPVAVVKMLLNAGANKEARDKSRQTALIKTKYQRNAATKAALESLLK